MGRKKKENKLINRTVRVDEKEWNQAMSNWGKIFPKQIRFYVNYLANKPPEN
jgi:hypothetical protein